MSRERGEGFFLQLRNPIRRMMALYPFYAAFPDPCLVFSVVEHGTHPRGYCVNARCCHQWRSFGEEDRIGHSVIFRN
jgi:hypothetical protein